MAENELDAERLKTFRKDVIAGLSSQPKYLSSKYFYDELGDKIFQEIMAMPSYYLTDCEFDILQSYQKEITSYFSDHDGFDLIELGAGDGKKTMVLLENMTERNFDYTYKPIDISPSILNELSQKLIQKLPKLKVEPEVGEYFKVLDEISHSRNRKKVILFLGSNIGNFTHEKAIDFLKELRKSTRNGDMLLIGFDLMKHPIAIKKAYDDEEGVTERFNKNLLTRINRVFDGNFPVDDFIHWESYNPETGAAKSYLIATEEMGIELKELNFTTHFDRWESIHMEISQKYSPKEIERIAKESGWKIVEYFEDNKGFYRNYLLI